MSLAEKIGNIYEDLNTALNDANSALVEKGGNEAFNILNIGNKIKEIEVSSDELAMSIIDGSITEIELSEITSINNGALSYCANLKSITIPDTVTSIGINAFLACINLTNATIGSGVTIINVNAFQYCSSLTNITIPDSVRNIGNSAFEGCTSLTNATIGSGVVKIWEKVFYNCNNLTDIYLRPTTPPTLGGANAIPSTTTIHVPIGSGEAYKNETNWSTFADNIVEDIVIE